MSRREQFQAWFPIALAYVGGVGLVLFVPAVWLLTSRIEPYLIGAFTTAIGFGYGAEALKPSKVRPPRPPDTIAPLVEDEL